MAKRSLRHGSGYLSIDHRESPGVTPADVAHVPGAIAVPGSTHLERDVQHCSHCQRGIVLNPLRTRDRGYCPKCHHYICDDCETIRVTTAQCVPMARLLDVVGNSIDRGLDIPPELSPLVLTDKE